VSEIVGLNEDSGFQKIKFYVTPEKAKECRLECIRVYPIIHPILLPPPLTTPDLGLSEEEPGRHCADILKWGPPKAAS